MGGLRYISHAEVRVDPDTPVPLWGLSDRGRARVQRMLEQPWVRDISQIVTSAETKAMETAEMLGEFLHLQIEVSSAAGEIDRSSTGYVPHDRHDELADQLFARPDRSASGWERAVDAQARIVDALADQLGPVGPHDPRGDVAVIGHGGVGSLLYCHLADLPISREYDQPRAGCHWYFDRNAQTMIHGWRPVDEFDAEPV